MSDERNSSSLSSLQGPARGARTWEDFFNEMMPDSKHPLERDFTIDETLEIDSYVEAMLEIFTRFAALLGNLKQEHPIPPEVIPLLIRYDPFFLTGLSCPSISPRSSYRAIVSAGRSYIPRTADGFNKAIAEIVRARAQTTTIFDAAARNIKNLQNQVEEVPFKRTESLRFKVSAETLRYSYTDTAEPAQLTPLKDTNATALKSSSTTTEGEPSFSQRDRRKKMLPRLSFDEIKENITQMPADAKAALKGFLDKTLSREEQDKHRAALKQLGWCGRCSRKKHIEGCRADFPLMRKACFPKERAEKVASPPPISSRLN